MSLLLEIRFVAKKLFISSFVKAMKSPYFLFAEVKMPRLQNCLMLAIFKASLIVKVCPSGH